MQITYSEAVIICKLFLNSCSEGLCTTNTDKLITNILRCYPTIINEEFYEELCWWLKK